MNGICRAGLTYPKGLEILFFLNIEKRGGIVLVNQKYVWVKISNSLITFKLIGGIPYTALGAQITHLDPLILILFLCLI